jgi:hypothetical protein
MAQPEQTLVMAAAAVVTVGQLTQATVAQVLLPQAVVEAVVLRTRSHPAQAAQAATVSAA